MREVCQLQYCCYKTLFFVIIQRKVKGTHVIDQAHIKQDTEERDFFSVFYYDEYSVSKDNQEIHLQQKVCC